MIFDRTKWAVFFGKRRDKNRISGKRLLISGVPVGILADNSILTWPAPSSVQSSHGTVLAASGAGKTVMVAHAIAEEFAGQDDVEETGAASYLVVDPKGDLAQHLIGAVADICPERLTNIHYLNPFSQTAFPFNLAKLGRGQTPVDIRAAQLADLVDKASTATGSRKDLGIGARQVDVLLHVLLGAFDTEHQDASVLWALDALTQPQGALHLSNLTRSRRAREFLRTMKLNDELRASCSSRLRSAFAMTEQLERLVSAPGSIQFTELLAPGQLCLVDLGQPPGGLVQLSTFWANLVVRLAIEHLLERPSPWGGHHCRLVIDEAQIVAPVLSDVAELILTTGRSRGISLITLSQGTILLAQASISLLQVLLTNTRHKFIGRLAAPDAELLAREQSKRSGVDESTQVVRERFATRVCNLQDRDFFYLSPGARQRFRTLDIDLASWRQVEVEQADAIGRMKTCHSLPERHGPRVTLKDVNQSPPDRPRVQSPKSTGNQTAEEPTQRRRPKASPWG